MIDVSDLLLDIDLAEPLTIYRQAESLVDGRTVITRTPITGQFGSVQPKDSAIGGNEITIAPEGEFRGAALTVHTKFRFRSVAAGFQPDILTWNGDDYKCVLLNNWSHYGAGYIEAEFASMIMQDTPPQ